jgi:hypothetical protein
VRPRSARQLTMLPSRPPRPPLLSRQLLGRFTGPLHRGVCANYARSRPGAFPPSQIPTARSCCMNLKARPVWLGSAPETHHQSQVTDHSSLITPSAMACGLLTLAISNHAGRFSHVRKGTLRDDDDDDGGGDDDDGCFLVAYRQSLSTL